VFVVIVVGTIFCCFVLYDNTGDRAKEREERHEELLLQRQRRRRHKRD
jgi:hypothetical protein